MKEIVLQVDDSFGEVYKGEYVFQGITWGKYTQIMKKHTVTNQGVVYTDETKMNADLILATLKSQPETKPVTIESLTSEDPEKGIPPMFGAKLLECACKVSGLDRTDFFRVGSQLASQQPQP
jgi:hypothetical protein